MKKEIIKSFDLEAYKNGAKIKTRGGREVRIICTDAKNPYFPIIALVKANDGEEIVISCTSEGKSQYGNKINGDDLVIVEEVEEPELWSDNKNNTLSGFSINNVTSDGIFTEVVAAPNIELNYDIFATKKQAKLALAIARISQIMANDIENFGGVITDEEWKDGDRKYVIYRNGNKISTMSTNFEYFFLAFHTKDQRDLFLEKYRYLVKDYLILK